MQFSREDLPAPFGPMIEWMCPSVTEKETPAQGGDAAEAERDVIDVEERLARG